MTPRWTLGYDKTFTSTVGNSPAALGNRIAETIINFGSTDGANEQDNYADTSGYFPVNPPMVKDLPGTTMFDPNRWQPLAFDHLVLQNGIVIGQAVQTFIGPNWGDVTPFAMSKASPTDVYHDLGAPPQLGDFVNGGDAAFKANAVEVIRKSSYLDPTLGNMIDISPGVYGNNPLGTRDGTGHGVNPVTGLPYDSNVVNMGDYGRAIAEFSADGPALRKHPRVTGTRSPTTWRTTRPLRNVSAGSVRLSVTWNGTSRPTSLNGAVHDAAVAAWNHKGRVRLYPPDLDDPLHGRGWGRVLTRWGRATTPKACRLSRV
ncbi:MAG: hypothetical protein R3C45_16670 [Phycisphaerales bacterium]